MDLQCHHVNELAVFSLHGSIGCVGPNYHHVNALAVFHCVGQLASWGWSFCTKNNVPTTIQVNWWCSLHGFNWLLHCMGSIGYMGPHHHHHLSFVGLKLLLGPYHHYARTLAAFCCITSIGSVGKICILNWLHSDMWPQWAAGYPTTIQVNWLCSAVWGSINCMVDLYTLMNSPHHQPM